MASVLRADERIVNYVKGLNYLDDRLAPSRLPLEIPALHVALPSSHEKAVRRVLDSLPSHAADVRLPMVQLTGQTARPKQLVAAHAASRRSAISITSWPSRFPRRQRSWSCWRGLWDREAALMPLALYLDEPLVDGPPAEASAASLDRFASRVRSLAFVSSREPRPLRGTLPVLVDVSRATATEQRDVWRALLPDADASVAERLSAQFDLSLPVIERVVADARAASEGAGAVAGCALERMPRSQPSAIGAARAAHRPQGDVGRPRAA
jgi:hypothetical protein